MIPPNASLVKYDNPVLVSRNTDKKSPRVSKNDAKCSFLMNIFEANFQVGAITSVAILFLSVKSH